MKADLEAIPDWVDEHELEQEFFAAVAMKLARHDGAALSPEERNALLELVRNRPAPKRERGRPRADWKRGNDIAMYCLACEWRGASATDAVMVTAKEFGISRSSVWTARKLFYSK